MLMASKLKLRDAPERLYWIYALVDPRNDEIRYVGQSLAIHQRFSEHTGVNAGQVKAIWLKKLQSVGLRPKLMVFESALTLQTAVEAERYWINYCRTQGANLLNDLMRDWRNPGNPLPVLRVRFNGKRNGGGRPRKGTK